MEVLKSSDLTNRETWDMLELSTNGVWHFDLRTNEVKWSLRLIDTLASSDDDHELGDVIALTHPDDREKHQAAIDAHLREGGPYALEVRLLTRDKGYRWFLVRGVTIHDDSGQPRRMIGFLVDTQPDHDLEDVVLRGESRFRQFMENCPAAAYVKGPDGRHLFVNQAAADLAGTTIDGMVGRTNEEIFPPKTAAALTAVDRQVLEHGATQHWSGEVEGSDRTKRWALDTKFRFEIGPDTFALGGFGIDFSDLRRAEQQAQSAQRLESIGRLAGGIAHDYNNMLAVILGHVEIAIMETPKDSPIRGDLEQIQSAAERSADITRQLLGFARRQTSKPVQMDLARETDDSVSMLRPLIGERIELRCHHDPELWPVLLDKAQLTQIITNLCINARDAIKDVGEININTRNTVNDRGTDVVELSVSDNGPGIDKKTMERIFEPFFSTKEVGEGTGLGLSTVYGIVQQNRGEIRAESEPGRGTTIIIQFPRIKDNGTVSKRPENELIEGNGEVILVVEDEPLVVEALQNMLTRLNYQPICASTAEEAIELSRKNQAIKLLITDVVMPATSGPELWLALNAAGRRLPTIFVSGHFLIDIPHAEKDVRLLQKPLSLAELSTAVADLLQD